MLALLSSQAERDRITNTNSLQLAFAGGLFSLTVFPEPVGSTIAIALVKAHHATTQMLGFGFAGLTFPSAPTAGTSNPPNPHPVSFSPISSIPPPQIHQSEPLTQAPAPQLHPYEQAMQQHTHQSDDIEMDTINPSTTRAEPTHPPAAASSDNPVDEMRLHPHSQYHQLQPAWTPGTYSITSLDTPQASSAVGSSSASSALPRTPSRAALVNRASTSVLGSPMDWDPASPRIGQVSGTSIDAMTMSATSSTSLLQRTGHSAPPVHFLSPLNATEQTQALPQLAGDLRPLQGHPSASGSIVRALPVPAPVLLPLARLEGPQQPPIVVVSIGPPPLDRNDFTALTHVGESGASNLEISAVPANRMEPAVVPVSRPVQPAQGLVPSAPNPPNTSTIDPNRLPIANQSRVPAPAPAPAPAPTPAPTTAPTTAPHPAPAPAPAQATALEREPDPVVPVAVPSFTASILQQQVALEPSAPSSEQGVHSSQEQEAVNSSLLPAREVELQARRDRVDNGIDSLLVVELQAGHDISNGLPGGGTTSRTPVHWNQPEAVSADGAGGGGKEKGKEKEKEKQKETPGSLEGEVVSQGAGAGTSSEVPAADVYAYIDASVRDFGVPLSLRASTHK